MALLRKNIRTNTSLFIISWQSLEIGLSSIVREGLLFQ